MSGEVYLNAAYFNIEGPSTATTNSTVVYMAEEKQDLELMHQDAIAVCSAGDYH